MNSKRAFFVMIGIISLLAVLLIAGTVFGNRMLKKEADKLLSLKLDNRLLEEQQTALKQANKDIETYDDLEKIAKTIVPQEKDQARTAREIVKIAGDAGITIGSITFPASNLGQAVPKPVVQPDDVTKKSGATDIPATPAAPSVSQVKAVDGISGLYQMEITVASDENHPVPYSNVIGFLQRLEQNRRTAQVSAINIQPDAKRKDLVTFNVVVIVYIKP
jgi:hypothetical protein